MSLFLTLQDSLTLFKLQKKNDLGNNLVYMTEGIVLAVYRQKWWNFTNVAFEIYTHFLCFTAVYLSI